MKTALFLSLLAVGALAVPTPPAPEPKPQGFEAFRSVRTRNIFDPNRRGGSTSSSSSSTKASATARVTANVLSLTGTMVSDGKSLAFFNGTRPEYSKVISAGASVGDFKVKAITPLQVELEHDGKLATLAVGRQLQLDGGAPGDAPADAPADAAAPPADSTAAPAADPKAELLRRMMERRAKETSK